MAAARRAKKDKEAMAAMKDGDSAMKTGLFKWSKDPLLGSQHYQNAARLFNASKNTEMRIQALLKSAECESLIDNDIAAGSQLEAAAKAELDIGTPEYAESAAVHFEEAGHKFHCEAEFRRAGTAFLEGAKLNCRLSHKEKGHALAVLACTIFDDSDKEHYAMSVFEQAIELLLEQQAYTQLLDDVLPVVKKAYLKLKQNQRLYQVPAIEVIIHLARNDVVAADRAFSDNLTGMKGWATARECELCEELVRCFQDGDSEHLEEVHALPVWGFLNNRVARLGKKLSLTGGGGASKRKSETVGTVDRADLEHDAGRSQLFASSGRAPAAAAAPAPAAADGDTADDGAGAGETAAPAEAPVATAQADGAVGSSSGAGAGVGAGAGAGAGSGVGADAAGTDAADGTSDGGDMAALDAAMAGAGMGDDDDLDDDSDVDLS